MLRRVIANRISVTTLKTIPAIPQFMWKLIEPGCLDLSHKLQIITDIRGKIETTELIIIAIFIWFSPLCADDIIYQHINKLVS